MNNSNKKPKQNSNSVYQNVSTDVERELLLWEKWIKIRKEETTHLAKKTGRNPADLVMNLLEKVREDKERKTALEHAVIEKKPTVRDTLWEQPQRLTQRCYCEPVYEVQRTRADLGRPPIIEHIGCPTHVQVREKGLFGVAQRQRCDVLNSAYEHYREKRENELKDKIKKIDPYRPKLGKLMVKGERPKTPTKKMPHLPTINVTSHDSCEEVLCSLYAIRINSTLIFKEKPGQSANHLRFVREETGNENCTSWNYYFNASVKQLCRSKIYLENLGTVTLRYCWKQIKQPIPFIPESNHEQVFFFNKNENVIFPGQKQAVQISFISNKPGKYDELWELSFCNTRFFDNLTEKLVFNLQADSFEDIERKLHDIEKVKNNISKKVLFNISYQLISTIINNITENRPEIYPYKKMLLESEIFVMKNPICHYHQTEVMKMKEYYREMSPDEMWNLSIVSWRDKMMTKEYDDRTKYYEILKTSYVNLLKPWKEEVDITAEKYRVVKSLLGQLADKFDEEYNRFLSSCGRSGVIQVPPFIDSVRKSCTAGTNQTITARNLLYLAIYDHVAATVETCAGVIGSLDLNRWVDFDFCRP